MPVDSGWSATARSSFAPGVSEQLGSYVYLLIDPRDDSVFYVGKGLGQRCFAHLAEARKTLADSVGDYPKLARIREIEDTGESVRIDILRHGLSEAEAFLVESVAIDLVDPATNRTGGHDSLDFGRMSVADINARYGATPVEIDPEHRVVLIRINRLFERGMSDAKLYEATRKWWRIGPLRRDANTGAAPEWSMAVYGGIVRGVYRIEGWERPTKQDIAEDRGRAKRWAFRGTRDLRMEELYLHRDVSRYLRRSEAKQAAQNPVLYVNCPVAPLRRMRTLSASGGDVTLIESRDQAAVARRRPPSDTDG